MVANFYREVCNQIDEITTIHSYAKQTSLSRYLKNSLYLYHKRYKVFKDPIAHLYKDTFSRDDYGAHLYLEYFLLSMYQSMKKMKINTVDEPKKPVKVTTYSEIWYYPSASIAAMANKVLKYADSRDGCTFEGGRGFSRLP